MPGQDRYRETHTSDLMTDYQTRRLATKIRKPDGTTVYAHTNDATAFAIGRILIAIMENNQTEKGTIKIPKVLQKYSGVKEIV
jgi:seryl-tRNA synthetase